MYIGYLVLLGTLVDATVTSWSLLPLSLVAANDTYDCERLGCSHMGSCEKNICTCPTGFGGPDCLTPTSGSPIQTWSQRTPCKGAACACSEGFVGPNCNVCTSGKETCGNPDMVCNTSPVIWTNNHLTGIVKDPLLLSVFNEADSSVTLDRNSTHGLASRNFSTAHFLVWYADSGYPKEQFYCGLSDCTQFLKDGLYYYECNQVKCQCSPESTFCYKGAIQIDDVINEMKGYFLLTCRPEQKSCYIYFDSLKDIAKDGILVETVMSGECAYPEQEKILTDMSAENRLDTMEWIGLVLIVLTILGLIIFFIKEKIRQNSLRKAPKPLPRTGINLAFSNLGYFVNEKQILKNVSGTCKSGRVIAIMGPSGAGKSTLLDILAGKSKSGEVQGDILVNGKRIQPKTFKNLAGYVDQEDLLLGSLTVRETLSFSAELRLPESLPKSEKMVIVDQTIKQLGLAHVSDSRIGGGGIRGISGGEKRRVSVGVEFVTSPSILFLDEPTSGLDSYNALMLVKTLANLAHKHGKTVIFTIHQPRSDVYKLFDDVLVLSKGEILYFGPSDEADAFCESKDRPCPYGYNIADHLLDMAVAIGDAASAAGESIHGNNYVPKKLAEIQLNRASQITKAKEVCCSESDEQGASEDTVVNLDVDGQNEHYTVSFLTQSTQLMRRSWKVLIRNPSLLVAHLSGSVLFGVFIGGLYYDSRRFEGMEGIQNRLGSVQFILSLVGFSSISAIGSFMEERLLYMRERSNGFYGPVPYFLSKLLFDTLPLRLIPCAIMSTILFFMIGYQNYHKYLAIMLVFAAECGLFCLMIACLIRDAGTANLVAGIILLFQTLLSGMMINQQSIPDILKWIQSLSFLKLSYEALVVNDLADFYFSDKFAGKKVTVQASLILTRFGFNIQGYLRDLIISMGVVAGMSVILFILLAYRLRETR